MFTKKFQAFAQVVGCVTIGLLAIYGLLALLGIEPVWAVSAAPDKSSELASAPVISATFNYQGLLRNSDGSLMTGAYTITARIYTTMTGGSDIYHETFSNVTVRDGLFNVVLGDKPQGQDLQGAFAATPRYIGITLVGQGDELIPRQRLHAAPWALYATNASQATDFNVSGVLTASTVSVNGNVAVIGKVTSAPTASGDISTTVATKGYVDTKWPDGSYCILRASGSCPDGFTQGMIWADTENSDPGNIATGTHGDSGINQHGVWLEFCCK